MKVDYIALSVPVFFILIGIELAWSFYKKLDYYRLNDSISNLSQGIGQQLTGIFMKTVLFFGYMYSYEHWRMFDLPQTIWVWILLFIGVDFFYYWFHRMSHQVNALWAAHIVHHQSEEYNLTVALRQSWFQGWFSWVFYLPLAFLGFEPLMFLTLSAFNTLYQFWIHTRLIKNMGPLEYILNTPSHHRVHHGSNPKYIDKNHAGTLIIWDRLFGTFQKEEEDVYYGITTPLASWNPLWANVHYWDELWNTARNSPRWADKINVFIKPPGWFPAHLGGFKSAPEIDPVRYQKYNPLYQKRLVPYVLFQFVMGLIAAIPILFLYHKLPAIAVGTGVIYVILTLLSCTALLEEKKWQVKFEYARLLMGILIVLLQDFPVGYQVIISGLNICSAAWFFNLQKKNNNAEEIPEV
ncbi:sterol desaturase family protein [Pedobacter gandavensis]|uniref:sterol desaturase family protein n=1 Tax=Pedobacter TaxID=84567 RepID=UPI001C99FF7F|nr:MULTISPECIES: sterol desaturase family protein [Pedobacter]WGQ10243.1 sterol desaturase family protein [Pedobacter gandavensis]